MLYPQKGTAFAIVAQLDRAFGSDPEGQRFESSRSHQEAPRHTGVRGLLFVLGRFSPVGSKFSAAKLEDHLAKAEIPFIIELVPRCARARFRTGKGKREHEI